MNRISSLLLLLVLASSCKKEEAVPPVAPTIITGQISEVTSNSAKVSFQVTSDGRSLITEQGIVWATNSNPSILNNKVTNGSGVGTFSAIISNLTPHAIYYVKAFATNTVGTSYGLEINFTTAASLPTVITGSITDITPIGAKSGGNVIGDGGATVFARGVVWSTSSNPTVSLTTITTDNTGIGNYTSLIKTLNWNTKYYVRAYATNNIGTTYGDEASFTTDQASITTAAISDIGRYCAVSGGTISSNAGTTVISRGVVWDTKPNPSITLTSKTSDGINSGNFQSWLSSLNPNSTYYARAYASDGIATAYGNEVTFITLQNLYFSSLTCGFSHTLALKTDGTLWAWGYNDKGQLGNGTTTLFSIESPTQIGTGYSTIKTKHLHSLAIKTDGTLWAWGVNQYGQLGDGTTLDKNIPVQIGSGYSAISAGVSHSLALKSDGTLWACGSNQFGQLGDGTTVDKNIPVQVGSGYSAISAGESHSLALKSDGTLWAWGSAGNGALGNGTYGGTIKTPVQIGSDYSSISAGGIHSLALKPDGTLWAWGNNQYGSLGIGTATGTNTPVQVGSGYSAISAGTVHSLALKIDGTLWAWGNNQYGQVGDGTIADKNTPVQIGSGYASISTGANHNMALKTDGTTWAWGQDAYRQLGLDSKSCVWNTVTLQPGIPSYRNVPIHM